MIHSVKVLNTVTVGGTDVSVDSNGILNMAGVATTEGYNLRGVTINTPVAPQNGVITITPTSTNSLPYFFVVNGFSKSTNLPKTITVSFTSAAAATVDTISAQARAIINADSDFTVAATGTSTIVLTSATGFSPEFSVGGAIASITSLGSASATTINTSLSAANGTAGIIAAGTPAILREKYGYNSNTNSMTYSDMANLTTGYYYTEVIIDYIGTAYTGSSAFKGEISTNQTVVFVRFDTAATTPSTTNYNDLLGTYGTVTGLAAGYRVSASAITGTAGTNTTNVQTMTSGVLGSEDVVSGDYIVGDAGVAATTTRKVISVLSQTTFLTTTATAITGSTFRVFKWRALPL
jgi:hypothetical protein